MTPHIITTSAKTMASPPRKKQRVAGGGALRIFAHVCGSDNDNESEEVHLPVTFSVRGVKFVTLLQNLKGSQYFREKVSNFTDFFMDVEPKHFRVFLNYQKFGRFVDNFGFGDVTGIVAVFAELKCKDNLLKVREHALRHVFSNCSGVTLEDRVHLLYALGIPELFCQQIAPHNLLFATRLVKSFQVGSVPKGGSGIIISGFEGAFFNKYVMFHKGHLNNKPYFESLKFPRAMQRPIVLYYCEKCRNWELRDACLNKIFHKPFTHRSPDFYDGLMACPSKPAERLLHTDIPWVYRTEPNAQVALRDASQRIEITHFIVREEFISLTKTTIFDGDLAGLLFAYTFLSTSEAWKHHLNLSNTTFGTS